MKKLIALLIALSMVFMFVACQTPPDNEPCTTHVDTNSDGKCDNCQENMTPENPPENPPEITGLILSNALLSQFENAKSMKIDFTLDAVIESDEWYYGYDETTEDYTKAENETDYQDNQIKITIVTSKNSDGTYNAKIDATVKMREDASAEYDTITEATVAYILGNEVYTYDEDLGGYIKGETENLGQITDMLTALTDGVEFSTDEENELLTELGDLLIATFDIKDYKGSISFDAKEKAEELIAYLAALDLEKDKVSDVLDDALALIDEGLTTAKLLTELERVAGLTVNEAIAEIDAWLTENYETTLQGIYDTIINDENTVTIIENYFEAMYSQGTGELPEGAEAEIAAVIDELKAFKLADTIEDAGIGEITLYDLIITTISNGDTEGAPTCDQMFDQIEAIFAMTLGEFFETAMEMPVFTMAKTVASGLTVNELNGKLDINFKGLFNIDSVEGVFNLDVVSEMPSEVENKSNVFDIDLSVGFKVYEISDNTVEIAIPSSSVILPDIFKDYYNYGEGSYDNLNIYTDDDGIKLYFSIYLEDGSCVYVYTNNIPVSAIGETITVEGNNLKFAYQGVYINHDTTGTLVLTVDFEECTFTVVELPEFDDPTEDI